MKFSLPDRDRFNLTQELKEDLKVSTDVCIADRITIPTDKKNGVNIHKTPLKLFFNMRATDVPVKNHQTVQFLVDLVYNEEMSISNDNIQLIRDVISGSLKIGNSYQSVAEQGINQWLQLVKPYDLSSIKKASDQFTDIHNDVIETKTRDRNLLKEAIDSLTEMKKSVVLNQAFGESNDVLLGLISQNDSDFVQESSRSRRIQNDNFKKEVTTFLNTTLKKVNLTEPIFMVPIMNLNIMNIEKLSKKRTIRVFWIPFSINMMIHRFPWTIFNGTELLGIDDKHNPFDIKNQTEQSILRKINSRNNLGLFEDRNEQNGLIEYGNRYARRIQDLQDVIKIRDGTLNDDDRDRQLNEVSEYVELIEKGFDSNDIEERIRRVSLIDLKERRIQGFFQSQRAILSLYTKDGKGTIGNTMPGHPDYVFFPNTFSESESLMVIDDINTFMDIYFFAFMFMRNMNLIDAFPTDQTTVVNQINLIKQRSIDSMSRIKKRFIEQKYHIYNLSSIFTAKNEWDTQ
jgi:hypothetical protein